MLATATLMAASPLSAGAYQPGGADDPLVAQLERALNAPAPLDIGTLRALRQLRDPTLRPLFAKYATSGATAAHRREGIFALAELDPEGLVDTFLITRIENPLDQLRLLQEARALNLLSREQGELLLQRPELPRALEAMLLLWSAMEGGSIDPSRAERLAASDEAPIRAIGALILLKMGRGEAGMSVLRESVEISGPRRDQLVSALLDAIRIERLGEASPFARESFENSQSESIRVEALAALLVVDPNTGEQIWRREIERVEGDLASTLRLTLAALHAADRVPPAMFDSISAAGEDLVRDLANAGRTVASDGASMSDALLTVIRTRYEPAIAWALDLADDLDTTTATAVRTVALREGAAGAEPGSALFAQATRAATGIADDDPDAYGALLSEACASSDSWAVGALLLGGLSSGNEALPALASSVTCPDRETEALRAILAARRGDQIEPATLEKLREIAGGWGGLSRVRRSQAAWLALRHSGDERSTLARLLASAAPTP